MSQVTVTAKAGPAVTLTAGVFTNVTSFAIDCDNEILTIVQSSPARTLQLDIGAATTITCTVSGNTYTVSIS